MQLRTSLLAFAALAAASAAAPPVAVAMPATATTATPIQAENALRGDPGWRVPRDAGKVITGYASEASVAPGETLHLHVSAPSHSRYRVLVYRLGWYQGTGGRLLMCVPRCASSRPAVAQPSPTVPDRTTGLLFAPWSVTDEVRIPTSAVSGYYEAKLEIVSGPHAGALGSIPLIVRERQAQAAVLVQVPVNTWQAYNNWGGKSLYGRGNTHGTQVSFDRPYNLEIFHDMGLKLELPWVRFLERNGVDVAYQTDVDTDRFPASLLQHRLVFSIGHDEYWTEQMRQAFLQARARSTNLMFGSNSELWRMRYDPTRRIITEWRNPYTDPVQDGRTTSGEFRWFGEPECQLMGVEYQEYAQRWLLAPPTDYMVVGPVGDGWLSAAGLKPGDVLPKVVGYEWDSLVPGCFHGRVVRLMHGIYPGSDGALRSADMVRATAPSGARVFAMGTMELGWALDNFAGQTPDRRMQAFVGAALRDLVLPAPPGRLIIRRHRKRLLISARLRARDPRVGRVFVLIDGRAACANALHKRCVVLRRRGRRGRRRRRTSTYTAIAVDRWGQSDPLIVRR